MQKFSLLILILLCSTNLVLNTFSIKTMEQQSLRKSTQNIEIIQSDTVIDESNNKGLQQIMEITVDKKAIKPNKKDMKPEDFNQKQNEDLNLNIFKQKNQQKLKITIQSEIKQDSTNRRLQQTAPVTFDWRQQGDMTSVKNQGGCGSSWAFSIAAFFQQDSIINLGQTSALDLSEQFLFSCSPGSMLCLGGDLKKSMDLIFDKAGIPLESEWTYEPQALPSARTCADKSSNLFAITPNTYRKSFYNVRNQETIKKTLLQKPIVMGVCASDFQAYYPTSQDRTLFCSIEFKQVDHSVLLMGYTQDEWIVKNSWGQQWGIDGYAYISRNSRYDCCIGQQFHTSALESVTCSVVGCQICVSQSKCYRCQADKYISINYYTNEYSCLPCTVQNCKTCQDQGGECQLCNDGYTYDPILRICTVQDVQNCLHGNGGQCFLCRQFYQVQYSENICIPQNCEIAHCKDCQYTICTACQPGFTLVDNNGVDKCQKLPCTKQNCILCDADDKCVKCSRTSFEGTQVDMDMNPIATNCLIKQCPQIENCNFCANGVSCDECAPGFAHSIIASTCVPATIENCGSQLFGGCLACKEGYANQQGTCQDACWDQNCKLCDQGDTTICTECQVGYDLNPLTLICELNPCQTLLGCDKCNPTQTECFICISDNIPFSPGANSLCTQETDCNFINCAECLLSKVYGCTKCRDGYQFDKNGVCTQLLVENCKIVDTLTQTLQYCEQCQYGFYVNSQTKTTCDPICKDIFCKQCEQSTTFTCKKCIDGYSIKNLGVHGHLQCQKITSVMPNCLLVTFNQSYCYQCANYYYFDQSLSSCQPFTQTCEPNCTKCNPSPDPTAPIQQIQQCICIDQYIWSINTFSCEFNTYTDQLGIHCLKYQIALFYDVDTQVASIQHYCHACHDGYYVDPITKQCVQSCSVPNCKDCYFNFNNGCEVCQDGYTNYVFFQCAPCITENCVKCNTQRCQQCQIGYTYISDDGSCEEITCNETQGLFFIGHDCDCLDQYYYDDDTRMCLECPQTNCLECTSESCILCSVGYHINITATTLAGNCVACAVENCLNCETNQLQCKKCKSNYFYDKGQKLCLKYSDSPDGVYMQDINGNFLICPIGCQSCTSSLICQTCQQGYTKNKNGECILCQGECQNCYQNSLSSCLDCYAGYFYNENSCKSCSDSYCVECTQSTSICTKCSIGYVLISNACQKCTENCLRCTKDGNSVGLCVTCNSGFVLTQNMCQPCIEGCALCTSTAIQTCVQCQMGKYKDLNSQCISCPSNCKTCTSFTQCKTCKLGYVIRLGLCQLPCQTGCKTCGADSQVCSKCFEGYSLSASNKCTAELSCNSNSSCIACPLGYALQSSMCIVCSTGVQNCTQCKNSNVSVCSKCSVGFYLQNKMCKPCDSSCTECTQSSKCTQCASGYYPLQTSNSNELKKCLQCSNSCLICSTLADKCDSCHKNYQLTTSGKCLSSSKIKVRLQLDTTLSLFTAISADIRKFLLKRLNKLGTYENSSQLIVLKQLKAGSIIATYNIAVPESQNPTNTYNHFKQQMKSGDNTQISGVNIISVSEVQSVGFTPQEESQSNNDDTVLIIVLAIVIPTVVIIALILLGCYLKKRARNTSTNLTQGPDGTWFNFGSNNQIKNLDPIDDQGNDKIFDKLNVKSSNKIEKTKKNKLPSLNHKTKNIQQQNQESHQKLNQSSNIILDQSSPQKINNIYNNQKIQEEQIQNQKQKSQNQKIVQKSQGKKQDNAIDKQKIDKSKQIKGQIQKKEQNNEQLLKEDEEQ